MSEEQSNKARILAVDDSRVMRRAITKILSAEYDVVETENGEDAWTVLTNDDSIQVVFTDLNMPFLDGFGLLQRMRESEDSRLKDIPVIIITGKDDDDDTKQQALDKGANDFITKPFDSVQLQARAKAHIKFKETSTKLTETSDKLERQATVDQTTGLGGQEYFVKVGEETLSYAVRHAGQFVVSRMDIDDFNNLFIKFGKEIMDKVLHAMGEKFSQMLRQEDTIARVGVYKFALILKETSIEDSTALLERIRTEVEKMAFKLPSGDIVKLSLSAGIYEPELNSELQFTNILTESESLMEKAVAAGGNQVVSHSSAVTTEIEAPAEDIDITELMEKLKANNTDDLLPQVDAILYNLKPLLKFLALNARDKFQQALRDLSKP